MTAAPDMAGEVARLRNMIENRGYATVYERAAWQHDLGQHADSALPYAFCPRCEMEHPLGAYHRLLDAAARLAELVDEGTQTYDPVPTQAGADAVDAFRDAAAHGTRGGAR